MSVPDEAVEAGIAAWAKWPEGVSPQEQMASILEAAAPHLMAQALREAAADARDPSVRDMDAYHIDQADVWLWLQNRAINVEAGTHGDD